MKPLRGKLRYQSWTQARDQVDDLVWILIIGQLWCQAWVQVKDQISKQIKRNYDTT